MLEIPEAGKFTYFDTYWMIKTNASTGNKSQYVYTAEKMYTPEDFAAAYPNPDTAGSAPANQVGYVQVKGNYIIAGQTMALNMWWETPDGVIVTGTKTRTFTTGEKVSDYNCTQTDSSETATQADPVEP